MTENNFADRIKKYIDAEIEKASDFLKSDDPASAFRHLERAHVLGQTITFEHTRVHWLMLKIGWKRRDRREIFGQIFRIIGASTKTPFGIYPAGNTGGANVSPFKPMSIPDDLQAIINRAKAG
jgi:Protein of unknown function (DUF3703)